MMHCVKQKSEATEPAQQVVVVVVVESVVSLVTIMKKSTSFSNASITILN